MKKAILIILILSLLIASCGSPPSSQYTYRSPENIGNGLDVGTLEEVNIDSALIENAVDKILSGKFGEVHSMLIYKNNLLVLEEYFPGHRYKWDAPNYHGELVNWDRSMAHEMMSVTKSFTSACIGIAIDKGFIKSVDQSIFDYLPDHQHLKVDNREYITIEHLVTMTSGLAWDEWSVAHGSAANDIDALWFDCAETITCVLERPWWLGQSHLKYERIVVSEMEAYSDGKTTCRKHSQALCRNNRPANRKCKGTHFSRNPDHSDPGCDMWSGWLE